MMKWTKLTAMAGRDFKRMELSKDRSASKEAMN
jgi:hypothetical protein